MIPQTEWKWFGQAAHFICGTDCRFHMATVIGDFLISTVGEYLPDAGVREILAESRGITLVGRGDIRLADYMEKIGYEKIGCDRLYETMVFKTTGEECDCGCGLPKFDGSELDFQPYNKAKDARSGHMEMCGKWASQVQLAEAT